MQPRPYTHDPHINRKVRGLRSPGGNSNLNRLKREGQSGYRLIGHISPSPVKIQTQRKYVVQINLPETLKQDGDRVDSSKILIRQFELIEFTKRFAIEKADYEDRIEQLQSENGSLKSRLSKIEYYLRKATHLYNSRYQMENQYLLRMQKLAGDLTAARNRAYSEVNSLRAELSHLSMECRHYRMDIEHLSKDLSMERSKILELDRVKLSMIDSNNKLSDENQQLVTTIRSLEEQLANIKKSKYNYRCYNQEKFKTLNEYVKMVRNYSILVEQELKSAKNQLETLAARHVLTSCLAYNLASHSLPIHHSDEYWRMKFNLLQIEHDHLMQQFQLEKYKFLVTYQHLRDDNLKLHNEVRYKSRKLFELTVARMDPSVSGINPAHSFDGSDQLHLSLINHQQMEKSQILDNDMSRVAVRVIEPQECTTCSILRNELAAAKTRCYNIERYLSILRGYLDEREVSREDILEQYEFMKGYLAYHFTIKNYNKKYAAKAKMMEEVIMTLKAENDELKAMALATHDQAQSRQLCQSSQQNLLKSPNFKKELKGIVFAYERDRITTGYRTALLQDQLSQFRWQLHYNNEKTSSMSQQLTSSSVAETERMNEQQAFNVQFH